MFKIYSIDKYNHATEVPSENGIYVVYELYEYKFSYSGKILEKQIFIEDELYDQSLVTITDSQINSREKQRIFEDYFGYLTIDINDNKFNFEVRIQKLKVSELEEILLFLWNQDPIIFDNFFSKSTLKSRLDKENQNLDYSSKFVNIYDDFYKFFKSRHFTFKCLPHYSLRKKSVITDYEHADISSNSIDWLVNNLDELHIDYLYKNVGNSIRLNNDYGLIEKILTEENIRDFNVYENQIILGCFDFVIKEINKIKDRIKTHVNVNQYYDKDFYSIDEFKVIPFLRLRDDLEKIEHKIKALDLKYRNSFPNTKANNSFPKLTAVFSNKKHYSDSYNKIKLVRDIKLNLDGELNLLNIKKISTLYERFNLFVLINGLLSHNPLSIKRENRKAEDNVFQEFHFQYPSFEVQVFYDYKIDNKINKTGLVRISSGYYKPDYILKIKSMQFTKYYILDSKYSSENTVKHNHLIKCIKNYILDIGISDQPDKKIEELTLLYPGENEETVFGNIFFRPKVGIMPSKVLKENLTKFLGRILPISEK